MKVLFAVLSLWAVSVLALRGDRTRYQMEVEPRDVEAFRANQAFRYRLDTQISSGMASVHDQHAVTRLQAEINLHFTSERQVVLRMSEINFGSLNHEIAQPERVQPFEMFKRNQLKSEEAKLLELPLSFDYVEGLVESIQFHKEDQPWSKNIKKSVLNMLQVNLKQRVGPKVELEQLDQWQPDNEVEQKSERKMFIVPEITLEGECQTAYTMTPRSREETRDSVKVYNVTKSIDFSMCRKVADIRYGPKVEIPCENCTTAEELEERKLDRTTLLRHVIVGTPEKYGIQKVELVSHYVFKMLNVEEETPMHTIVAGQLVYIQNEKQQREDKEREIRNLENKQETLLYTTEWDEKEKMFYMYGDEEFPQNTPFEKIQDKVSKVEKLMSKLITLWSDKKTGIEAEAALVYTRLVDTLRMCNQRELEQIMVNARSERLSETEQLKTEELLTDAFANAGTFNTIKVLVNQIINRKLTTTRAARVLAQLKDLPAPSEKQVEVLTHLCQNEVCSRYQPCRQTCWLTTGAILGELCNEQLTVSDALEQKKASLCHQDTKQKFIRTVMAKYSKVETRYEKILLLKALGNAGLDLSVVELEKVIRNIREDPLVRMQAIDSLRRLRAVMPEKIQRLLVPVFQDIKERPEVRMAAISQILATIPAQPVLDMLGHSLIREPSRQVKSYIYTAMKSLSESPVKIEKELAQHLKMLVKLAGISEEDEEDLLRGSRFYRMPIYSKAKKEGFFVDLESMVGPDNVIPKHLHAGLDSFLNGIFKKSNAEISFTQEDLEQWYENIMNAVSDYYGESRKSLRANRRSDRDSREDSELTSMYSSLNIKRRSKRVDESDTTDSPYGMFSFRLGDIDYAILPFEEEILSEPLRKIVNGERPTMRDFENIINTIQGRTFRVHTAMNLLENSIKIPSSMGLPIRMLHILPVIASVEGQIKPKLNSKELKAEIHIHPMLLITHLKRVEIWSPIINSGVETTRQAMLNLPVQSELVANWERENPTFKWSVQVPEHKFRLVSLQTLPLTFISELEYWQQRTPIVKRLENQQLMHQAQHIERVYGQQNFDLPLKVVGEIHYPHKYTYEQIMNTLMTSENHLHIDFVPESSTPREIVMLGEGQLFVKDSERKLTKQHRELKGFFSRSKFDEESSEEYQSSEEDDERKLDKYLDEYEPRKMYKHYAKIQLKTVGGRKEKHAQVEIEGSCDEKIRFCKANVQVERSPLFQETNKWTLESMMQVLLPEQYHETEKYQERSSDKQQKFVASMETKWGISQKQQLSFNVNGEKVRNRLWAEKIEEIEKYARQQPKLREQMMRKVAFLNKYDISAQYKNLEPTTVNFFNWASAMLKSWNFWKTQVEYRNNRDQQVVATIVIDPLTHEHANITVKTPSEIIRVQPLSLPMKMKPFQLVDPSQESVESFGDMFTRYTTESRPECKVDSRKVNTFDDVTFKAPLTKCYTTLAKDCRSERPRFAVFMKKLSGQDKKLKMVSGQDVIEIEPKSDKLEVKINGRKVERKDYETFEEYGIDYSEEMVRISTKDVTVRFDGQQATIKISSFYKNGQCGLCGNYDDNTDDEYRMNDNELTSDIKSFHKSYSVQDTECRDDLEETYRREEYEPIENSREEYERDEEYQQRRSKINDNDETEPIEKTEVIEHAHKICFSLKPVKTCPEESYPGKTKEQKTSFTCLDRTSTEARRLLRQARREQGPIEIPSEKASFVQQLTVPTTCVVY